MAPQRSRSSRRSRSRDTGARAFTALALFVGFVFLTGGGARDDIASLLFLRPGAVFFAAYAWLIASPGAFAAIRAPLALLAALALLCVAQLIPLPPGIWQALPGHDAIAARDALVGLDGQWRPLSLSPSKTLNSLVSLSVPFAALLLAALQPARLHERVVAMLLVAAIASALLGLAQVIGPAGGPLYLYRVTNPASAVGLFSNRNHHAVFLAAMLPLAAWYLRHGPPAEWRNPRALLAAGGAFAGLLAIVVVVSGSRAGLVLFGVALPLAAFILWKSPVTASGARPATARASGPLRWVLPLVLVAVVALVVALPSMPAYQRFGEDDIAGDVRFTAIPTILEMARAYFPFGAGFGTFEHVFKVFEPDSLLKGTYLNQAHDDLLQLAVEAGVPGLLILLAAIVLLARRGLAVLAAMRRHSAEAWLPFAALASLSLIAAASVFDYPLRAPTMMAVVAVLVVLALRPGGRAVPITYVESAPTMR